jgi:KaiC/GvpD/RAD55 family RecA-like ATPase
VAVGVDRSLERVGTDLGVQAHAVADDQEVSNFAEASRRANSVLLMAGDGRPFWRRVGEHRQAVVVVTAGRSTVHDLRRAVKRTEDGGAAIVGIVIERASRGLASYRAPVHKGPDDEELDLLTSSFHETAPPARRNEH